ncbi:MAG: replication protein [Sulfurimonas sp.]|uniref:hypothetical protein n=1 Tax=Sulfurimonas sp. TaxID=2022749 RepID=UPI003D0AB83D
MNKLLPNSFQIPNAIVDDFIKLLACNDLKIYMIIVRKTKGWNKEFDGIAISQFMAFGGISSHNTVRKSLKNLEKLNLIKEVKQDGKYSLFCLSDPYQNLTMSNNDTVEACDEEPLPKNDIHPYQKMTIQKDTNKEEEERRKKFFEDFYKWIPKMNVKNEKWFKKSIKQNLLNSDAKTIENFEEFMSEQSVSNNKSKKSNIAHQQFALLLAFLSNKSPNQILKDQKTEEYLKVFDQETINFILKRNGLVELASSIENQNYHSWLLKELEKEYQHNK